MKRLFLIDGSSILSTSFFGTVPNEFYSKDPEVKEKSLEKVMKTSDGRYTNGVYEMTKKLLKLVKDYDVQYMAIAWDVDRESLVRKQKFAGYKSHRGETPEELKAQFPLMQEVLDSMGIKQFSVRTHEADDILGTFAKKFEQDIPVVVMTKDQDALQLIGDNTRVWLNTKDFKKMIEEFHEGLNPKQYKVLPSFFEHTIDSFEHFYGIKPHQIIDKKALEGDKSDGIPGVKGVGPLSVIPLLNEYGTIEGIYEAIESTPEAELKIFFKEDLGIKQSPIGKLLKKTNLEIVEEIIVLLDKDYNKQMKKEVMNLFKEVDDKAFKEKAKLLDKADEISFKEEASKLSEELRRIDSGLVGKQAAFLSKELATINCELEVGSQVELNDLLVSITVDSMKKKFEELQFKSLL